MLAALPVLPVVSVTEEPVYGEPATPAPGQETCTAIPSDGVRHRGIAALLASTGASTRCTWGPTAHLDSPSAHMHSHTLHSTPIDSSCSALTDHKYVHVLPVGHLLPPGVPSATAARVTLAGAVRSAGLGGAATARRLGGNCGRAANRTGEEETVSPGIRGRITHPELDACYGLCCRR